MQRIDSIDGLFHEGNPATGQKGTKVTADFLNHIQEEIANVVEATGVALDPEDQGQLIAALTSHAMQNLMFGAGLNIGYGNPYAWFSVTAARTTGNFHCYEDLAELNLTDTDVGYASFDAKATMNNVQPQNHFAGYQCRNIYNSAQPLTAYMHGYDTNMTHNGAGVIAKVQQVHLRDIGGLGPVTESYGLYIERIQRGSSKNYAIYSDGGESYFKDLIRTDTNFETAVGGGFFSNLYYSGGWKYRTNGIGFGTYAVGGNRVSYVAANNAAGAGAAAILVTTQTVTPAGETTIEKNVSKKYTWAALPAAVEGQTAFCTNGRKMGELAGAGTGIPVYFSNGAWRRYYDDQVVTQ